MAWQRICGGIKSGVGPYQMEVWGLEFCVRSERMWLVTWQDEDVTHPLGLTSILGLFLRPIRSILSFLRGKNSPLSFYKLYLRKNKLNSKITWTIFFQIPRRLWDNFLYYFKAMFGFPKNIKEKKLRKMVFVYLII